MENIDGDNDNNSREKVQECFFKKVDLSKMYDRNTGIWLKFEK